MIPGLVLCLMLNFVCCRTLARDPSLTRDVHLILVQFGLI